jgi:FixJ family two-component response regulator
MRRKVVAVVDNDPSVLKALERLLTAHGFVVESYISGEAFLQRGAQEQLACLVLDIHLDGISGIQLQRHLAASGSALPVIFLTALDSLDTRQDAMDAGCAAFLRKPIAASSLIEAIGNATD